MHNAPHIVILTGAGISAESGIRTFRDTGGLWEDYSLEDVATPQGFMANPSLVHRFYNDRRAQLKTVEPNAAHKALADLETRLNESRGTLTLVTQNVDDLHERGGSHSVIHMHGELASLLCANCGHRWSFWGASSPDMMCPHCKMTGGPRPDVVWFGEMPYHMERIEKALTDCDMFVSIGTSGAVYPAAGFVTMARQMGKQTLELNLEPSDGSHFFHESRLGPATQSVPEWVGEVVSGIKQ